MGVHPAYWVATTTVLVSLLIVGSELYGTLFSSGTTSQLKTIARFTVRSENQSPDGLQLTVQQALHWASVSWSNSNQSWQSAPRPLLDSYESSVTSEKFEQLDVGSLNPPEPLAAVQAHSPLATLELQSRLVIGIAAAVHGGGKQPGTSSIQDLHLIKTTLASLVPTLQPAYNYRIYLAFDDVDPMFSSQSVRDAVVDQVKQAAAAEDGRRWHPSDYQPGVTVDPSTLLVTVHWVRCNYTAKPAWAQNDAAVAAFREGADFVFRTNDDTQLPERTDWLAVFINDLRSRQPFPNVGVVGPRCDQGNTAVLTHDFTHRTHVIIHGFYYPRSMPTWYGDEWMTKVYQGFTQPLMVERQDVSVVHKLSPQRYDPKLLPDIMSILKHEVAVGQAAIKNFTQQQFHAVPAVQ